LLLGRQVFLVGSIGVVVISLGVGDRIAELIARRIARRESDAEALEYRRSCWRVEVEITRALRGAALPGLQPSNIRVLQKLLSRCRV
jgi:hypothetical protein